MDSDIADSEDDVQLFVGGIHKGVDIDRIRYHLSLIGHFKEFRVIVDNRGVRRGYAFMTVPSRSLSDFLGKEITLPDTRLFINKAQPKSSQQCLSTRIYFMKDMLDQTTLTVSKIQEHLSSFGQVDNIYIYKNHLGKSKGYGFCDFQEASPLAHLFQIKLTSMVDGTRLYFHKGKDSVKRKALQIQKKARKNKYRRDKKKKLLLDQKSRLNNSTKATHLSENKGMSIENNKLSRNRSQQEGSQDEKSTQLGVKFSAHLEQDPGIGIENDLDEARHSPTTRSNLKVPRPVSRTIGLLFQNKGDSSLQQLLQPGYAALNEPLLGPYQMQKEATIDNLDHSQKQNPSRKQGE